jgi:sulfide:quinone oxidoreductase
LDHRENGYGKQTPALTGCGPGKNPSWRQALTDPRERKWQLLIPGPWAHWMKIWFEKYFLWKMRTGRVNWP